MGMRRSLHKQWVIPKQEVDMNFASRLQILLQLHTFVCPHMLVTFTNFGINNLNG